MVLPTERGSQLRQKAKDAREAMRTAPTADSSSSISNRLGRSLGDAVNLGKGMPIFSIGDKAKSTFASGLETGGDISKKLGIPSIVGKFLGVAGGFLGAFIAGTSIGMLVLDLVRSMKDVGNAWNAHGSTKEAVEAMQARTCFGQYCYEQKIKTEPMLDKDGKPVLGKEGLPMQVPVLDKNGQPQVLSVQWYNGSKKVNEYDMLLDSKGKSVLGTDGKPVLISNIPSVVKNEMLLDRNFKFERLFATLQKVTAGEIRDHKQAAMEKFESFVDVDPKKFVASVQAVSKELKAKVAALEKLPQDTQTKEKIAELKSVVAKIDVVISQSKGNYDLASVKFGLLGTEFKDALTKSIGFEFTGKKSVVSLSAELDSKLDELKKLPATAETTSKIAELNTLISKVNGVISESKGNLDLASTKLDSLGAGFKDSLTQSLGSERGEKLLLTMEAAATKGALEIGAVSTIKENISFKLNNLAADGKLDSKELKELKTELVQAEKSGDYSKVTAIVCGMESNTSQKSALVSAVGEKAAEFLISDASTLKNAQATIAKVETLLAAIPAKQIDKLDLDDLKKLVDEKKYDQILEYVAKPSNNYKLQGLAVETEGAKVAVVTFDSKDVSSGKISLNGAKEFDFVVSSKSLSATEKVEYGKKAEALAEALSTLPAEQRTEYGLDKIINALASGNADSVQQAFYSAKLPKDLNDKLEEGLSSARASTYVAEINKNVKDLPSSVFAAIELNRAIEDGNFNNFSKIMTARSNNAFTESLMQFSYTNRELVADLTSVKLSEHLVMSAQQNEDLLKKMNVQLESFGADANKYQGISSKYLGKAGDEFTEVVRDASPEKLLELSMKYEKDKQLLSADASKYGLKPEEFKRDLSAMYSLSLGLEETYQRNKSAADGIYMQGMTFVAPSLAAQEILSATMPKAPTVPTYNDSTKMRDVLEHAADSVELAERDRLRFQAQLSASLVNPKIDFSIFQISPGAATQIPPAVQRDYYRDIGSYYDKVANGNESKYSENFATLGKIMGQLAEEKNPERAKELIVCARAIANNTGTADTYYQYAERADPDKPGYLEGFNRSRRIAEARDTAQTDALKSLPKKDIDEFTKNTFSGDLIPSYETTNPVEKKKNDEFRKDVLSKIKGGTTDEKIEFMVKYSKDDVVDKFLLEHNATLSKEGKKPEVVSYEKVLGEFAIWETKESAAVEMMKASKDKKSPELQPFEPPKFSFLDQDKYKSIRTASERSYSSEEYKDIYDIGTSGSRGMRYDPILKRMVYE